MAPLTTLTAAAALMPEADIDTDIIFPARFLLITAKRGLGRYAFYDKRHGDGVAAEDFPLTGETKILIAGPNFGCGSSREQAVWALHDLGVRVILAESFGEIFRSNCFNNGVLPIALPSADLNRLAAAPSAGLPITVDLVRRTLAAPAMAPIAFEVEDWRRQALLNGWDEVMILLNTQADAIDAFEDRRRADAPWLFASP